MCLCVCKSEDMRVRISVSVSVRGDHHRYCVDYTIVGHPAVVNDDGFAAVWCDSCGDVI